MDYTQLAANAYHGARERAEVYYGLARERSEAAYDATRERLERLQGRWLPTEGISLFGLVTLPQRLLKWAIGALIAAVLVWLAWWWIDGSLRSHYLGSYNIEKQLAEQKARKKAEAKIAKLQAALEAERTKREAAENAEREADARADQAMADIAAKGQSTGIIDIAAINNIIKEANK